jgi:branched-chain amino acid transport system permease protein
VIVAVLVLAAILVRFAPLSGVLIGNADLVLVAAFGAYGLNLITGYAGQASFGNAGFMAIGGLSGWVVGQGSGNFALNLVLGTVGGFVCGAIVGAVVLRFRGFYLVLATLAVQSVAVFVMQEIQLKSVSLLGGFSFAPPTLWGLTLAEDDVQWFAVLAVVLAIVVAVLAGLVDSKFGRAWMAIRENEGAAAVSGINVIWMKILVFSVGSAVIALGGTLSAMYAGSMSYDGFTLELSTSYIAMIIIGGLGTMVGPLLGALVVSVIPYLVSSLSNTSAGQLLNNIDGGGTGLPFLETILYCVIVLLFLALEPRGLASLASRVSQWVARRRPPAAPPEPSSPDTARILDRRDEEVRS